MCQTENCKRNRNDFEFCYYKFKKCFQPKNLKSKRKICLLKTVTKNLNFNFYYCLNLKNFVNRSKFACSLLLCRGINLVVTV